MGWDLLFGLFLFASQRCRISQHTLMEHGNCLSPKGLAHCRDLEQRLGEARGKSSLTLIFRVPLELVDLKQ